MTYKIDKLGDIFLKDKKTLQEHTKQERKNTLLLQESWFHSTHEKKTLERPYLLETRGNILLYD